MTRNVLTLTLLGTLGVALACGSSSDHKDAPFSTNLRGKPAQTAEAAQLLESGWSIFQERRFEQALAVADQVLAMDAGDRVHSDALGLRGSALHKLDRPQQAMAALEEAVRLGPDVASNWTSKGIAHRAAGELAEAVACYETALSLDPEHAEAWLSLGVTRTLMGDFDAGLEALDRGLALLPDHPSGLANRAVTRAYAGDLEGAAQDALLARAAGYHGADTVDAWLAEIETGGDPLGVRK